MLTHLSHALSYVLVLCLTLQIAAAQNVYAADGSPPSADQKHVLILFGGGNSTPALQQLMNGITSAVRKDNLFSVNVKIEILDIAPPKYPGHRLALQEMLRNKYATQRIDLIITVFNAGFDFLKEEGKELFPDVPAISILANPSPPVQRAGEIIPQFPVHLDLNGTLERALEMFPDTRRVVFVSGKTKENREREQRARAEFAVWRSKLEFEYPSDLPLSDLLKYVGNLPPKTIIIYSLISADDQGKPIIPRDAAIKLGRAANVPIFSYVSTMHDTGIVGGMMLNVDSYGEMIGHAVTRFVRGQRIAVEPTAAHVVPMFDWNQIQRWQADIDRLPPNSLFVNRPPTLWGQYKREVISSLIVMLLLGISLIITLAQSRHRRKAELAATKLADSIREMKEASETHLTQQVHARTHDLQAEVRRRAKAEALAQESEFQYRFMADNSLDILWRWNFTQCRFTYASPSVERLCGLATEKFIDLPLEGVFIPDSVETFVKNLRADNRSMWLQSNVLELALLTSNREPLWTETLVSLVKNPTSGETEVIGVSRDITLKRRAKEEQQQFIAMISHEFRTPLAIIRATAERMSEREYSGRLPEQAQFRKIENAVDWLTELMDEFVSDSRMAFDSTGVSRTLIDPVSLLKAASAKMMESASTHGINIHQAVVRSQFLLDPCLIGMALTTLVENAVKHTPPGTQIELSARQSSDGGLYLSVADNGPGIPEDELPLIGNKFFRARNAHSIYGSGLGVYLAKNIARLHGGSLSVTNRPQGGACFQIHLPLDPV